MLELYFKENTIYFAVIPSTPDYVIEKITTNTLVIKWHMPRYSFYKKRGLEYDIRVRSLDETFDWMVHSNYELRHDRSEYKIIIRDLPYAYFSYQISLRIRVKRQIRNDERGWSKATIKEFRTAACAPFIPPRTDVSSFYIGPTETTVRLYWHQLPTYMENGPNFTYAITKIKRDGNQM